MGRESKICIATNQPDTVDHGLRIGGEWQQPTQQNSLHWIEEDVGRAAQKYHRIAVKQAGQALHRAGSCEGPSLVEGFTKFSRGLKVRLQQLFECPERCVEV